MIHIKECHSKVITKTDQLGNQVDKGENSNSTFAYFRHVFNTLVAFKLREICNNSPRIFKDVPGGMSHFLP